jgi:membrane protease YdiL (CAAX protease family)
MANLGITVGQGWRRAVWIGTLMFLVLFMVLLSGRWLLRAAEAVEERVLAASVDPDAPDPDVVSSVGQVRTAVQGALDRARRRPNFSWHQLWAILVALLIGPACEEIFFRGLIFGSVRKRWPFWAAALVSSLVFAFAHGLAAGWGAATMVIWFEITAGGLAAAYSYERTGTLFAPLVMHMLWNAAQTATDMAPV